MQPFQIEAYQNNAFQIFPWAVGADPSDIWPPNPEPPAAVWSEATAPAQDWIVESEAAPAVWTPAQQPLNQWN